MLSPAQAMLMEAAQKAGVTVENLSKSWSQDAVRYSYNGKTEVMLEGNLIGSTSVLAQTICNDLPVARQVLRSLGLPIPKGRVFHIDDASPAKAQIQEAIGDFWEQGKIYRCLPGFSVDGHGIASNLRNLDDLEMHLDTFSDDYGTWILEEQVDGIDLQILAIGGELVSGIVRSALRLEGDGVRTLEELIDAHNSIATGADVVTIDAETRQLLRDQNIYLSEQVPAGQKVQVKNPGAGGGGTDVTNKLHASYADWVKRICDTVQAPMVSLNLKVFSPDASPTGKAYIMSMSSKPDWTAFQNAKGGNSGIAKLVLEQMLG
ncbi:MAG: hypothetical protein U0176_25180 [Bacteroidia bacterium]